MTKTYEITQYDNVRNEVTFKLTVVGDDAITHELVETISLQYSTDVPVVRDGFVVDDKGVRMIDEQGEFLRHEISTTEQVWNPIITQEQLATEITRHLDKFVADIAVAAPSVAPFDIASLVDKPVTVS